MEPERPPGTLAEVFRVFLKLGLTSFGGPIAHLGYFRRALVERAGWVSESQFGQLLAICQFLPGPASSQLGFTLGLLRAGWAGAIAAFLAFTLPSALLLFAFAVALPAWTGPTSAAVVHGLKLVACAVVAHAVLGMSRTLSPDRQRRTITVVAAGALLLAGSAWAQMIVVAGGAAAGMLFCRIERHADDARITVFYGRRLAVGLASVFIALLIVLAAFAPAAGGLLAVADAFYRAGALVFGGGHVVLPLLEESVVQTGWITEEQFLSGYGAAQAIPGPMFSFSAYLGATLPSGHPSWLNAGIALAFMFLPGFLMVSAALPLWQALSRNPAWANAVAGVNAAVVGLLAAALYDPIFVSSVRSGSDLAIAIVGFGMLAIWRLSPLLVVGWCVFASLARGLL